MARKKKKRKQRRSEPQAAGADTTVGAEAAAAAQSTPAPESTPTTESTPTVQPQPAASAGPPPALPSSDEPLADLDADDADDSYESLVAAVAGLEDDDAPASTAANGRASRSEDEEDEVHDLDDDSPAPAGVQKLIAQVGRSAPAEQRTDDFDDDVPVIDLDDDVPPPVARRGPVDAAAPTSPEVARLARAAAAGAVHDPEPPPIPLDLFGDISTPEARARLLAEALAHAEHKEARYRVPLADTRRATRWKSAAASLLLVLAGVVAVAPPAWVRPEPPAQLSEAARARGLRLALILQAQQVEAYRVRTQQLPPSLDDLPVKLDGLRYARSGRSYQLVAFAPDGSAIVYDAADPAPGFRALQSALAPVVAP